MLTEYWRLLDRVLEDVVKEDDRRAASGIGNVEDYLHGMRSSMQSVLGIVTLWDEEISKEERADIEAENARLEADAEAKS